MCVCVYVQGTMTGIFVYISCLSREELLTFDDGPTELPGSLHQPNSANCWHTHMHALSHIHTHTHAKRNIPTQPGSPCISLSDHVNKCRIHNSVYEFTKSPFTLSVYHTDQPLSALFITFSLWDATPRLIVSGWEAAISFCLWYLQGATELSLHVHLVSNGPCGATFHSVAGQGCTQALRLLILTERTCPFRDSWGVATQDCLLLTHTHRQLNTHWLL